jgi:hypothetical protein
LEAAASKPAQKVKSSLDQFMQINAQDTCFQKHNQTGKSPVNLKRGQLFMTLNQFVQVLTSVFGGLLRIDPASLSISVQLGELLMNLLDAWKKELSMRIVVFRFH